MTHSKLPPRWRHRHGAYYFRVPDDQRDQWDGKSEFRLGKSLADAWRTWFERTGVDGNGDMVTMNDVFTEWWREYVLVELAKPTQRSYEHHLKPLRKVFGNMRPGAILPVHAYRYRSKRPTVAGNREVSCLSSALSFAVEKGVINNNPLRGQIRRTGKNREKPRSRLPSLEEISDFLKVAPHLAGYVTLKRITGLRQNQLLAIDLKQHYHDGVLHPPTSKGGKDTRYHGQTLEAVIEWIVYQRHGTAGLLVGPLFVNRQKQPMTSTGLKSAWRRAMAKYEGVGGEKFNEHDIRKTTANEAETLEEAQRLLGHQESKTTARVYRIGPEDVEALK